MLLQVCRATKVMKDVIIASVDSSADQMQCTVFSMRDPRRRLAVHFTPCKDPEANPTSAAEEPTDRLS